MPKLRISYDLCGQESKTDYRTLIAAIGALGVVQNVQRSIWNLTTKYPDNVVYDVLLGYIDSNDRLDVIDITDRKEHSKNPIYYKELMDLIQKIQKNTTSNTFGLPYRPTSLKKIN